MSAYNDMSTQLSTTSAQSTDASVQTALDIQQRVQAVLKADADPSSMSSQLQGMGIQLNQHGQLEIDSNKLDAALRQKPARLQAAFAGGGPSGQESDGLARRLQDMPQADASTSGNEPTAQAATADSTASSAGAIYKQKLLEQYAQASSAASTNSGASTFESELALPENAG